MEHSFTKLPEQDIHPGFLDALRGILWGLKQRGEDYDVRIGLSPDCHWSGYIGREVLGVRIYSWSDMPGRVGSGELGSKNEWMVQGHRRLH